jgi:5-oxoprolinase (ATP-hydrolysing)
LARLLWGAYAYDKVSQLTSFLNISASFLPVSFETRSTRITDPEILEKRYPVILRQFSLREGSGGAGCFYGGAGVVRELEFTRALQVSILSERLAFQPYGLEGGESGARGLNLLYRADGRAVNLGGKNSVQVGGGDRIKIHTPGGGGFGDYASTKTTPPKSKVIPIASTGSLNMYILEQESV